MLSFQLKAKLEAKNNLVQLCLSDAQLEFTEYKAIYYVVGEDNSIVKIQKTAINLVNFIQLLLKLEKKPPLYLITVNRNEELTNGALIGLHRTLTLERPDLQFTHIEIETSNDLDYVILEDSKEEREIVYRNGNRLVARLSTLKSCGTMILPAIGNYKLVKDCKEQIEGITIEEVIQPKILTDYQVEMEIRAASLNFRDILILQGLYPGDDSTIGGEGCGKVLRVGPKVTDIKPGNIVYGMIPGAFANYAISDARLLAAKPESISDSGASTLPIVFSTVYYGLVSCANLQKGERVLIHTASGGVGLSALQVAKLVGAEIYVTAGTDIKRAYLQDLATEYNIKGIYDSRSTNFADEMLKYGREVDVVINTLTGPGFLEATIKSCKKNARFIEISKRDIWTKVQMQEFRPDIAYHIIAIDNLAFEQPDEFHKLFKVINKYVGTGEFKTLPATIYPLSKTADALNYLRKVQHIGKIVLEIPQKLTLCQANAFYLITGGLGGLGLRLASYLVDNGAKHIALVGRNKPKDETIQAIEILKVGGTVFNIYEADISKSKECHDLIAKINQPKLPLKGIFHLAGILDDGIFTEQTPERFISVFAPKVSGAWNLHEATKVLTLDHFVMFSSIAGSFGSPGQANYAAANSFLTQLTNYRKSQNLPSLSIDWGPWAEVGRAANLEARHASAGMIALKPELGFKALGDVIVSQCSNIIVAEINWKILSTVLGNISLFANLALEVEESLSLITSLNNSVKSEHESILKTFLKKLVRQILRLRSCEELPDTKGFFDMGMDSLMAVALRNRLQKAVGRKYPITNTIVFDYPNIEALAIKFASLLQIDKVMPAQSQDDKKSSIIKMDKNEVESEINKIIAKME